MQIVRKVDRGRIGEIRLPDPDHPVLPGLAWGRIDELFTSAYWATMGRLEQPTKPRPHRLGSTLTEEVAACVLGGHGIPAEVGLRAFRRLRDSGVLAQPSIAEGTIEQLLSEPLLVGDRMVRYRFARQKSRYLVAAIRLLHRSVPPDDSGRALRDWLLQIAGVGWKTASWVARNWLDADDVAILDIHVCRAGWLAGVFDPGARLPQQYLSLEARFIEWSSAIDVRPSLLDAIIWREMRSSPQLVSTCLKHSWPQVRRVAGTAADNRETHANW